MVNSKVPMVYKCFHCGGHLMTWGKGDSAKGRCGRKVCRRVWALKDLKPVPRSLGYVPKRSIKNFDSVSSVIDRERCVALIKSCPLLELQGLMSILFLTGSRISEVCTYVDKKGNKHEGIKKLNFIDGTFKGKPVLWVRGLKLLKQRNDENVPFEIRPDLPISYKLDGDLIYYAKHFMRYFEPDVPLFKFQRYTYHKRIKEYCELFPHLFRDLRVMDLYERYDWDMEKLQKFFGWKNLDTLMHYFKLRPADLINESF